MSRLSDVELDYWEQSRRTSGRLDDMVMVRLIEEVRASRLSPGERERALEEAVRAVVGEPDGADDVFTLSRACNRILALASPSRTDGDATGKGGGR